MRIKKFLPDVKATEKFAFDLAQKIKPGQVVYLYGALGSGKTTLVQNLLKSWGYEGAVTSPTFSLLEPYTLINFNVYHFDFYRVNDPKELSVIGIKEYFNANSITLIEWPDIAAAYIPTANWKIHLDYFQQGREIEVEEILSNNF